MLPATRAEVLSFLKKLTPPLIVHEVTSENEAALRAMYEPSLGPGEIVWELSVRSPQTPGQIIGILISPSWRVAANEGPTNVPLEVLVLERLPPQALCGWGFVRHGQAT